MKKERKVDMIKYNSKSNWMGKMEDWFDLVQESKPVI